MLATIDRGVGYVRGVAKRRRFPSGIIASIAALIGVPAFSIYAVVGGVEALGRTNGSGDGGDPMPTAGYVAWACAIVFVIAIVVAIGERLIKRSD
jgi:hypothetical protein